MRLASLSMERYAHVSGEALVFPANRGLHVVSGANEAGKSTALKAIADALFGFDTRRAKAVRHPDDPRIGFALRASDGTEARFVRRKRTKDSLLNEAGQPIAEAVLLRFLGGTSRQRFEEVFGLNGDRLREAGRTILSEHGDAGSAVLQAQTGLHGLRDAVGRLDAEAAKLFGDGRGRRVISQAAQAVKDNRRLIAERSLSGGDYAKTREQGELLSSELDAIADETKTLRGEQERLNRIRRTAPVRRALAQLQTDLAALGTLADLPDDARARYEAAAKQAETASHDLGRDRTEASVLQAALDALSLDPAILAEAAVVQSLADRREKIAGDTSDRLTVSGEAKAKLATLDQAAAQLGVAERGVALRARLPVANTRTAAETLVQEQSTRQGAIRNAQATLERALRDASGARGALAACPVPPNADALRDAIEAAAAEGAIDTAMSNAADEMAQAATELARSLSQLPLWSGDAAQLAATSVPLEAEATRIAEVLEEAAKAAKQTREAEDRHRAELDAARDAMTAEERTGPLPQADAIADLRGRRDTAWRLVRRHYVEGGPPASPTDWPYDDPVAAADLPGLLDRLLPEADALADRRITEVERVQRWETAKAGATQLAKRSASIRARVDDAERAHANALGGWHEAWAPVGIEPQSPAAMREWVRDRGVVLAAARRAEETARKHDTLAARRDALPAGTDAADVTALRQAAARRLKSIDADMAARGKLGDNATRTALEVETARDAIQVIEREAAEWLKRWTPVAARLGLPPDVEMAAATETLSRWASLESDLTAWETLCQRVAEMTGSIDSFDAALSVLATRLAIDDADPLPTLTRRLHAAQSVENEWLRLSKELSTRAEKIRSHEHDGMEAAATLASLRRRAGVDDDDAVLLAIARAEQHVRLSGAIGERQSELRAQDDGRSETELAAEAESIEWDAVPGRLDEIMRRLSDLDATRTDAAGHQAETRATLARMEAGQDVAGPAEAVQDGLAEIEEASGRYVRLRLAHALLKSGIERFRRSQQGPLLARASEYFAELTTGRYERLEPDENDRGEQIIVAVRADQSTCAAEMLSEGTLDQLFLALRLASIALDASVAEPLPFIADDLLVNFDDERARSALKLLARFGQQTQVILFTHHEHLLSLLQPDLASLHRLPGE